MSRSTLFKAFEYAIPIEVCDVITKEGHALTHGQAQLKIDGNLAVKDEIRKTQLGWMPEDNWVNGLLSNFVNQANKSIWNFDYQCSQGVQFGIYGEGSHYDWHKDEYDLPFDDEKRPEWRGLSRKLTAAASLNAGDEYEGGDFEIMDPWGNVVAVPQLRNPGTVVVFPAYVVHRVAPVLSGTRYSIVSWHLGKPFR